MRATPLSKRPDYPASARDRVERAVGGLLFRLPPRLKLWLCGGVEWRTDGLTLHPDLQLMLRARAAATKGKQEAGGGLTAGTLDAARASMRRETLLYQGPEIAVGSVHELTIERAGQSQALRARHYAPPSHAGDARRPLCVFFHGGGFVIGDLDTHDAICRLLCRQADVHVLSIDYRLAPEHAFPAAVDDAIAGFRFAVEHAAALGADEARIGVCGDSAGGNLAAVVAQQLRDERAPDFAVLIYPAVDRKTDYPSKSLFARSLLLTGDDVALFDRYYFGADDGLRSDPRLSPLLGELRGLCPTAVITAGFDLLRDEGEAYAAALARAGVRVIARREPQLLHGFIHLFGTSPACRSALDAIAADLRALAHQSA